MALSAAVGATNIFTPSQALLKQRNAVIGSSQLAILTITQNSEVCSRDRTRPFRLNATRCRQVSPIPAHGNSPILASAYRDCGRGPFGSRRGRPRSTSRLPGAAAPQWALR